MGGFGISFKFLFLAFMCSFLKPHFSLHFLFFSNIFMVQVYFSIFSIHQKVFSKKLDKLFPQSDGMSIFMNQH